jgi:anti-sigma regulatory factor (Ser/Thr protein kinase)
MTALPRQLSLSLEVDARSLAPMRRALRAWLIEIDADEVADVVLAVDEAVANAIEHVPVISPESITVRGSAQNSTIHIEVCNSGLWKDTTPDETRGRGLMIMNAVMDSVVVEHQDAHTRVVMIRQVRQHSAS